MSWIASAVVGMDVSIELDNEYIVHFLDRRADTVHVIILLITQAASTVEVASVLPIRGGWLLFAVQ